MTYVISDIHGCYDKYIKMLEKIKFKDIDVLYVLGDVVDRGEYPIKTLRDMSLRHNVFPIMGNHDYTALIILDRLSAEITEDNFGIHIDNNLMQGISLWISDGGQSTMEGFKQLPVDEREFIIEYLKEFSAFEIIAVNNKNFILTHSGTPELNNFRNLKFYKIQDLIGVKTDYSKKYFEDAFLVTGHTPTFLINEKYRGKIYRENNHIAIDTGAVFGEVLSCICLETDEEFYV